MLSRAPAKLQVLGLFSKKRPKMAAKSGVEVAKGGPVDDKRVRQKGMTLRRHASADL
jgi:predicted component of type VI protein secretion system